MLNGFLTVNKRAGRTSHDVVNFVRKLVRSRRVGHGGTLDPMATGVLVVAVGKATRFLQYLTHDKEYDGVIRYGICTTSDDITGVTIASRPAPWLKESLVEQTLHRYVGTIDQVPPLVSAIKKDGTRLYEIARRLQQGEDPPDLPPRRVQIHSLTLNRFTAGDFPEASIHVHCGKGTYIRSIARESGQAITIPGNVVKNDGQTNGSMHAYVGGTLTALTRTRSGAFELDKSHTTEELERIVQSGKELPLVTVENALLHLPRLQLNEVQMLRWRNGGNAFVNRERLEVTREDLDLPAAVRVYDGSSKFLGVWQLRDNDNPLALAQALKMSGKISLGKRLLL